MQTKNTITWIDEDSDLLHSVVEPLEWSGYCVARLHSVREAQAAAEQMRHADLLLLELLLPEGRPGPAPTDPYAGLTLLEELRETYQIKTPAVILTVVNASDVLQRLTSPHLGVVAVLRKPVLPSELKATVERALRSPNHPAA
jgi:CheY-like chemotaxis protein